jgi:hypothetical protein
MKLTALEISPYITHGSLSYNLDRCEFEYICVIENGGLSITFKPLSKYWLIQIFQVFILRLKY